MTPASADAGGFGLANLPLGVFSPPGGAPRIGTALGANAIDVAALQDAGLLDEPALAGTATLNAFLAAGRPRWTRLRARLQHVLGPAASAAQRAAVDKARVARANVTMHLPFAIGDYVDFYSSIEHATNVGRLFRPSDPLLPNYRYVPIGYHGRAATVVVDGTPIRRPAGQAKASDAPAPVFGPTRELDYELETAFVVGPGNAHGVPIPIGAAREHIYGMVLLNDWSARDLQSWEYQPLGPFLGKSFATSISPWVVSLDALEPFRVASRVLDPAPLPYLRTAEPWAYDLTLEVALETARMRQDGLPPATVARTNARNLYWHAAQQLAHLTSNGACVRPGDLCASGTISGTDAGTFGSLIEATLRGTAPLALGNGETRGFLADGDRVILRGWAGAGAERISLGDVSGTIDTA